MVKFGLCIEARSARKKHRLSVQRPRHILVTPTEVMNINRTVI